MVDNVWADYDKLVAQGRMDKRRAAVPPVVVDDRYISFKKPEGNPSAQEMIKFITDIIIAHSLGEAITISDATGEKISLTVGPFSLEYFPKNAEGSRWQSS